MELRKWIPAPREVVSDFLGNVLWFMIAVAAVVAIAILDSVNPPGVPSLDTLGWYLLIFVAVLVAGVQIHTHRSLTETTQDQEIETLPPGFEAIRASNGVPFYGGSDLFLDIPSLTISGGVITSSSDFEIEALRFTMKQGKKTIVKDKLGEYRANNTGRLPISWRESRKWKTGYVQVQVTALLRGDRRIVLRPSWIEVVEPI
jgi:hypothetical protein